MLEIILVILALIAIAGVCIYFYVDMKDHKATNTTDFEKVNKNIQDEETTRLGNIKYVVDQVNTTNEAMDAEYTVRLDALEKNDTGFGKLIVATDAAGTAITDLSTVGDTSKLKLMKDVSVIGSMSIKDLEIANRTSTTTKPSFKACGVAGTGATAPCIEFPNSEGHTYLTGLTAGKHVVSGSLFEAKAGAEVTGILKTDTLNNFIATNPVTIQTQNGSTLGNTITVGNAPADGITLVSGTNTIVIKNDTINITTGATTDEATEKASLQKIQLNGKGINFIKTPTAGTLPADTKVLTLAA